MFGHYQARVDDCKLLSDIPLEKLDPRYVAELERRAYEALAKIEGLDTPYIELKSAYTEVGELQEMVEELRRLLRLANERV
jgi:hypothetical protein